MLSRRAQDQQGDLATTVEESVLGIRVLKAFGRGPELAKRFADQARELRGTELAKNKVFASLWAVIILLPETAIALMLLAGMLSIVHGAMTVGTLVAAITVATYLRWPTDSIGWLLAETNQAATACERYWEVRDEPITDHRPAGPAADRAARRRDACGSRTCGSRSPATAASARRCCAASTWSCGPARRSRWSAPPAAARRR